MCTDAVDYLLDSGDEEILGSKTGVVGVAQGNSDSKNAVYSEIASDIRGETVGILVKAEIEGVNLKAALSQGRC
jgi:hypothetical protein